MGDWKYWEERLGPPSTLDFVLPEVSSVCFPSMWYILGVGVGGGWSGEGRREEKSGPGVLQHSLTLQL